MPTLKVQGKFYFKVLCFTLQPVAKVHQSNVMYLVQSISHSYQWIKKLAEESRYIYILTQFYKMKNEISPSMHAGIYLT